MRAAGEGLRCWPPRPAPRALPAPARGQSADGCSRRTFPTLDPVPAGKLPAPAGNLSASAHAGPPPARGQSADTGCRRTSPTRDP
eukprot:3638440-Rhodomonas_salina.1